MPLNVVQINYPVVLQITNITTVGTAARVDTGAAHPLLIGDMVTIVNVVQPSNLNGTFPIIAIAANTFDVSVVPNAAYVAPATATDDKAMLVMNAPDRRPRDGSHEGLEEHLDGDHHGIFARTLTPINNTVADRLVAYFEPGIYVLRLDGATTAGLEIALRVSKALTDQFDPRQDYTLAPHANETNPLEVLIGTELRNRFKLRAGIVNSGYWPMDFIRLKFSAYTKVGMMCTTVATVTAFVELGR